ncbi:protein NYNRIN-like, partial [Trifolium medium]|nr:protein NYNRIN-like [Trifolium medium]
MVQERPWFADMANYKVSGLIPNDFNWHQKKRFIREANQYVWDDPYLFKIGADNLLRICVTREEATSILWHCHSSPYGGHYNGGRTAAKVLQLEFYWPTLFKDAHQYAQSCDKCQKTGGISKRNEMPLQNMLEVEVFDCWGIDFVGPFPSSFSNEYILVAVDYVSKWVEAIASPKADGKFLKKIFFTRFGTPRVLISDGGSHFCN